MQVTLSNWPDVICFDIFQGCRSEPGKIVVDTLSAGATNLTSAPFQTSLSVTARSNTLQWSNIRIVRGPRQNGRYIRTVFEDSRWKLRDVTLGENYNVRDCQGRLYSAQEKTVSELVGILASASGLTISVASSPSYKPLADWRGKCGDVAMEELLERTGCRLIYNPVSQQYVFSLRGSGSLPDLGERTYRQPPATVAKDFVLWTAPITYEKKFQCTAKVFDQNNALETVASPEDVFTNWSGIGDARKKSRYQHGALRLWMPSDSNVMLLGRRALSVAHGDDDITYAAAVFTEPSLASLPKATALIQPSPFSNDALSVTGGGKLFQCQQPRVEVDGSGNVKTTAEILSAYYTLSGGKPVRSSKTIEISPSGVGNVEVYHDWIRPISSTEADVSNVEWDSLRDAVAANIHAGFSAQGQHVEMAFISPHGGAGVIGGARWTGKVFPMTQVMARTAFAINFEPTEWRNF
jgi:hypothetical protein